MTLTPAEERPEHAHVAIVERDQHAVVSQVGNKDMSGAVDCNPDRQIQTAGRLIVVVVVSEIRLTEHVVGGGISK